MDLDRPSRAPLRDLNITQHNIRSLKYIVDIFIASEIWLKESSNFILKKLFKYSQCIRIEDDGYGGLPIFTKNNKIVETIEIEPIDVISVVTKNLPRNFNILFSTYIHPQNKQMNEGIVKTLYFYCMLYSLGEYI